MIPWEKERCDPMGEGLIQGEVRRAERIGMKVLVSLGDEARKALEGS